MVYELTIGRPTAVMTDNAPPPAGAYSQAVIAGRFVFVSGQTPRSASGERRLDSPFAEQVSLALDNLEAIARAADSSLRDAVSVTVYLTDPSRAEQFDEIYRLRVGSPAPARAIVQSSLITGAVEITAVLYRSGALG